MATEFFHPSEIARLILGYLKEKDLKKSYKTFLRECPDLQEYWRLLYKGSVPSTSVMGLSLQDILDSYCSLRLTALQPHQHSLRSHQACFTPGSSTATGSQQAFVHQTPVPSLPPITVDTTPHLRHSYTADVVSGDAGAVAAESIAEQGMTSVASPKAAESFQTVVELVDPLERLMEETRLHEKLAESINRALQGSSFLDELAEAVSDGEAEAEKQMERLTELDQSSDDIVRANIDNVVALTTSDPKFEELLSLVNQDAPSLLQPSGSNGDMVQNRVHGLQQVPDTQPISVSFSSNTGRVSHPITTSHDHNHPRNMSTNSSSVVSEAVEFAIHSVTVNSSSSSTSEAIQTCTSVQQSPSVNKITSKLVETNSSHSKAMPPPAVVPEECSRRSKMKRHPKKSFSQRLRDKDCLTSQRKDSSVCRTTHTQSIVISNLNLVGVNTSDSTSCVNNVSISESSQNESLDDCAQPNKELCHTVDEMNIGAESAGGEAISSLKTNSSSSQNSTQYEHASFSTSRMSDNSCNENINSEERKLQSERSNQDLTLTNDSLVNVPSSTSSRAEMAHIFDGSVTVNSNNQNTANKEGQQTISSHTEQKDSIPTAPSLDNNASRSSPSLIWSSSENVQQRSPTKESSAPGSMNENSLSVFSLIEKNIAEMHGETFIPWHLRKETMSLETASVVSVTSSFTSASSSSPQTCTTSANSLKTSIGQPFHGGQSTLNTQASELNTNQKDAVYDVPHASGSHSEAVTESERTSLSPPPHHDLDHHPPEGQIIEAENASIHSSQSDNDFDNQPTTHNAVTVRQTVLQGNLNLVDECLKSCLGVLVNGHRLNEPVSSTAAASGERPGDEVNNHNTDAADNNNESVVNDNVELQENDNCETIGESSRSQRAANDSSSEKNSEEECRIKETGVNDIFNGSNTINIPFVTNRDSGKDSKNSNLFTDGSGSAHECASLPALLPSMKKTSTSPDSTNHLSSRPSAFKPLSRSDFLKPLPFMSPPALDPLGRRKVISVDCLHSPYIPDHCKKMPSRRITPVEVSYWTPSPLQVPSPAPSSPANFVIDLPMSPSVPASPGFMSPHAIASSNGTKTLQTVHQSSPASSKPCRRTSQDTSPSPSSRSRERLPSMSQAENLRDSNSGSSHDLSNRPCMGIQRRPLSPSKRKPRRIVPTMLAAHTVHSKPKNQVTSSSPKNITIDDAKTVSSSSDLPPASEEEAFRILKSHLFTYTKPQPKQEITSSGQTFRSSSSPMSKCSCVSRGTCKHRKGRGRRSPLLRKTGHPHFKTPSKSNANMMVIGSRQKEKSFSENGEIGGRKTKAKKGNLIENSEHNQFQSSSSARDADCAPTTQALNLKKTLGNTTSSEECVFRAVGTIEFHPTDNQSASENLEPESRHAKDCHGLIHTSETLLSPTYCVQEQTVSSSPRKKKSPGQSVLKKDSSPRVSDSTQSAPFLCLSFEKKSSDGPQPVRIGSDDKQAHDKPGNVIVEADNDNNLNTAKEKCQQEKQNQNKDPDPKVSKVLQNQIRDDDEAQKDNERKKYSNEFESRDVQRPNLPKPLDHPMSSNIERNPETSNHSYNKTSESKRKTTTGTCLSQSAEGEISINDGNLVPLSESEIKVTQINNWEERSEFGSKLDIEVSAPYFPELSNTRDFFNKLKSKCFSTHDSGENAGSGKEVNINPQTDIAHNQIDSQQSNNQKEINSTATVVDVESQSQLSLISPKINPKIRPPSPDAISTGISLLRQAMDECDIPRFPLESEVSKSTICDVIIEEPQVITTPVSLVASQPEVSTTQVTSLPTSSRRIMPHRAIKNKPQNVQQVLPKVNEKIPIPPAHGMSLRPRGAQRFKNPDATPHSQFVPVCPKSTPLRYNIVFAHHAGQMFPFLLSPTGPPIMLPQSFNPTFTPPSSNVGTPCPATSTQGSISQANLAAPSINPIQPQPSLPVTSKVSNSNASDATSPVSERDKSSKKNDANQIPRHLKKKGQMSKVISKEKRLEKAKASESESDKYTPRQKVAVRRTEISTGSPSASVSSSYFKKGLRKRTPSNKTDSPSNKTSANAKHCKGTHKATDIEGRMIKENAENMAFAYDKSHNEVQTENRLTIEVHSKHSISTNQKKDKQCKERPAPTTGERNVTEPLANGKSKQGKDEKSKKRSLSTQKSAGTLKADGKLKKKQENNDKERLNTKGNTSITTDTEADQRTDLGKDTMNDGVGEVDVLEDSLCLIDLQSEDSSGNAKMDKRKNTTKDLFHEKHNIEIIAKKEMANKNSCDTNALSSQAKTKATPIDLLGTERSVKVKESSKTSTACFSTGSKAARKLSTKPGKDKALSSARINSLRKRIDKEVDRTTAYIHCPCDMDKTNERVTSDFEPAEPDFERQGKRNICFDEVGRSECPENLTEKEDNISQSEHQHAPLQERQHIKHISKRKRKAFDNDNKGKDVFERRQTKGSPKKADLHSHQKQSLHDEETKHSARKIPKLTRNTPVTSSMSTPTFADVRQSSVSPKRLTARFLTDASEAGRKVSADVVKEISVSPARMLSPRKRNNKNAVGIDNNNYKNEIEVSSDFEIERSVLAENVAGNINFEDIDNKGFSGEKYERDGSAGSDQNVYLQEGQLTKHHGKSKRKTSDTLVECLNEKGLTKGSSRKTTSKTLVKHSSYDEKTECSAQNHPKSTQRTQVTPSPPHPPPTSEGAIQNATSPFSSRKSKHEGLNPGKAGTSISSIMQMVYTGLERNKLRAMLRKRRGIYDEKNKGKRRSLRQSECIDYYEDSDDDDEEQRSCERNSDVTPPKASRPHTKNELNDSTIPSEDVMKNVKQRALHCDNCKVKRIIKDQSVRIRVFNSGEELINMLLLNQDPFPMYVSKSKTLLAPVIPPRATVTSRRKRKVSTNVSPKPNVTCVCPVNETNAEAEECPMLSPIAQDGHDIANVQLVDEQEELDRAVQALQEANLSWSQPSLVDTSISDSGRDFEDTRQIQRMQPSPVKYKHSQKSFLSPQKSVREIVPKAAVSLSPKTNVKRLSSLKENLISKNEKAKVSQNSHKSMMDTDQSMQQTGEALLKRKANVKERSKRKRSDSPDYMSSTYSMESPEDCVTDYKKLKRNKSKKVCRSDSVERRELHVAKPTNSLTHLEKPAKYSDDTSKEVAEREGRFSHELAVWNSPIKNIEHNNMKKISSPILKNRGASYLLSISEAELSKLEAHITKRSCKTSAGIQEKSLRKKGMLDGLELLSSVAVDADVSKSSDHFRRIDGDSVSLAPDVTQDSREVGPETSHSRVRLKLKGQHKTSRLSSNVKVKENLPKASSVSPAKVNVNTTVDDGDSSERHASQDNTAPTAMLSRSQSANSPVLISQDESLTTPVSSVPQTTAVTASFPESQFTTPSTKISPSQGKSISPSAMHRLLKKLYKSKKTS